METATLLALLFKKAGLNRARISRKTIKLLAYRVNLRSAFVLSVSVELSSNYGLYLIELDSGGFGIVPARSLEAAKPVTAKRYLTDILEELKYGKDLDFEEIEEELAEEDNQDLDE
jgi:hypothetical protein